jgi:hypothetical protein
VSDQVSHPFKTVVTPCVIRSMHRQSGGTCRLHLRAKWMWFMWLMNHHAGPVSGLYWKFGFYYSTGDFLISLGTFFTHIGAFFECLGWHLRNMGTISNPIPVFMQVSVGICEKNSDYLPIRH